MGKKIYFPFTSNPFDEWNEKENEEKQKQKLLLELKIELNWEINNLRVYTYFFMQSFTMRYISDHHK